MEFDVVVEVPKGSRNKYEIDHASGVVRRDRQLFTATRHPADHGFVPGTLGEDGGDPELLTVPAPDPRSLWQEIGDVPEHTLLEIRHFFEIYKDLEPGKRIVVEEWSGREAAEALLRDAVQRAQRVGASDGQTGVHG